MSGNRWDIFNTRELYVLTTGRDEWKLLYAPLADAMMLVNDDDLDRLAAAIESPDSASDDAAEAVRELCDTTPVSERGNRVRGVGDFINLSILPNNICNFSCSYCYSAKGRSSRRLELAQAKRIIDWFLSTERNASPKLSVSIFGGGEPLISWEDVVRPSVEHLYRVAEMQRRTVVTTLITNGSIIPNGFAEMCRRYNIDLVCSYDILEDVQNAQRRHFALVTENIGRLIAEGVVPAVNAVVTELNVGRQREMIETLHCRFPEIRHAAFEPATGLSMSDKGGFYKRFSAGFVDALRAAEECGIKLTCSALRNVDVAVDRYCAGELALCADGSLSICPCVSSAEEPNFQRYVYGRVSDSEVVVDEDKLKELLSHDVYGQPWCQRCFAKWNCGGGCMNTTILNGNKPDADYCRFMRTFLKYMLAERLDKTYIAEMGQSIADTIGDYGYFITEQYL